MVPDFCCTTPLIWILEVSVARESSACEAGCWRGTATARGRFAFWKAFCAVVVHSNVLPPPPPTGDQSAQHLCAIGQKTTVKVCHVKKTLQLFDDWRGAEGASYRPWGPILSLKSFGQEPPKRALQKHFFRDWWRDHWWPGHWKRLGEGVFACSENQCCGSASAWFWSLGSASGIRIPNGDSRCFLTYLDRSRLG